jgi:uncharacterized phage infection (PIP) family protein YhgE
MTTKFETRSNPATSNLDIKDPTTGQWVQAIAKLRTAGGDEVKLIPEQYQLIKDIASALSPLSQIAKTVSDSQASNQAISTQLNQLQQLLSTLSNSNTLIRNDLNSIAAAIATAIESLNQSSQATTSLASRLNSLPQSLINIEGAIANLSTILELIKTQTSRSAATSKFSAVCLLDTVDTEKSVQLPDGTKTLYFSGRKNDLGQSFSIRHALKAGEVTNIATGKYETLWAYSEFTQSDLFLNGATLYLASSSAIAVEVHAWY